MDWAAPEAGDEGDGEACAALVSGKAAVPLRASAVRHQLAGGHVVARRQTDALAKPTALRTEEGGDASRGASAVAAPSDGRAAQPAPPSARSPTVPP